MAFDKDAFLAAFLERTAEGIDKRSAEADQYKEEQKALAEREAAAIKKRKMTAQTAAQYGRQLKNMGVSDAQIGTALSSGMAGITNLHQKITQAVEQKGVKRLGVDDIEAIVSMPNIPGVAERYADLGLDQFAAQTFGAVGQAAAAPEQKSKMAQLFGFGGKERVDAQLREQQYGDGMTYADINAAARLSDYQSLFPEATMTFTDIPAYGRKEKSEFASELSKTMTDAAYGTLGRAQVEAVGEGIFDTTEKAKLQNDKRIDLSTKAAMSYIEEQMSLYGEYAVLSDGPTARAIKDAIGVKALNELRRDNGMDIPEADAKEEELLDKQKNKDKPPSDSVLDKDPIVEDIRDKVQDNVGFKIVDGSLRVTKKDAEGKEEVMSVNQSKAYFEDNKDVLEGLSYKVVETQLKETEKTEADKKAPMPKDLTDDQDNTNAAGEKIFELNSDGTAPVYPEDNFMESLMGADIAKKRRQKLWMKLFGETHNPDGSLK